MTEVGRLGRAWYVRAMVRAVRVGHDRWWGGEQKGCIRIPFEPLALPTIPRTAPWFGWRGASGLAPQGL